jgi:hypothetical protein
MPGPFYFAWAGGLIEEQTTLVTNGTTHGAAFSTVALVGDLISGDQQLINIASVDGLIVEAYYELSGPGIPSGTRFLFDDSILSGLPNSVNLTSTASSSTQSATFVAKQAVNVGVALATFVDGSASVTLTDTGSLPAGTYAVFGTGIGETDIPGGDGALIVGTAIMSYDGAGGGALSILAATPHTTTGTDEFGQPTTLTTYTVASQPVRATATGQFPIQINGFPDTDAALITDIPSSALAGLESGLLYNITGNGIPIGATFVAPASGTEITLDLEATASDFGAILTITGPRTANAAFNPSTHNRFDEQVLTVVIEQTEGDLATLTITLKNPNIGLLAVGRNLWCWLSWDENWPTLPVSLVPLFNGRLIGVPQLAANEIIEIQFLARPDDLNAQKVALSDSLKVLPYYDPVWLVSDTSPDTVLETYSKLWHIDRTTLELTSSDIITGEDGTIDIDEDHAFYDHFELSYNDPPLMAVEVSGTVTWQQQAEGTLDITQTLLDAFVNVGSGYTKTFPRDEFTNWRNLARSGWSTGGGGLIQSLAGDGLKSDWPRPGTVIGGGWRLSSATDNRGQPLCYIIDASKTTKGGWLTPAAYKVEWKAPVPLEDTSTEDARAVGFVTQKIGQYSADFPIDAYKIRMNLEYRANRKRTETITAVVAAGVQRELSDSAESDREIVSLSSDLVGEGVDPEGRIPIGDVSYRSYFQTGRGTSSFEYLLLSARAKLRARARSVDVSFSIDWRTALGISLRHNVRYIDRRVPGGECTGKVKSYKLSAGETGMIGEFVVGCTIGTGFIVDPQAGANVWAAPGYVTSGYQAIEGRQVPLIDDEISYQTLTDFVIADDGLNLTDITVEDVVNECLVTNGMKEQMAALAVFQGAQLSATDGDPITTMKGMTTTVLLDLKPVAGGEFHTSFYPAVTALTLPQTIDLGAPSGE